MFSSPQKVSLCFIVHYSSPVSHPRKLTKFLSLEVSSACFRTLYVLMDSYSLCLDSLAQHNLFNSHPNFCNSSFLFITDYINVSCLNMQYYLLIHHFTYFSVASHCFTFMKTWTFLCRLPNFPELVPFYTSSVYKFSCFNSLPTFALLVFLYLGILVECSCEVFSVTLFSSFLMVSFHEQIQCFDGIQLSWFFF